MASFSGVFIGKVVDNADPLMQGRLRVRVPAVSVQDVWAPACILAASGGAAYRVNDEVVVGYEGGSPNHPIVLGKLG